MKYGNERKNKLIKLKTQGGANKCMFMKEGRKKKALIKPFCLEERNCKSYLLFRMFIKYVWYIHTNCYGYGQFFDPLGYYF